MGPPDEFGVVPKRSQVGNHQVENQEGDDAGFPGDVSAEPNWPHEKASDKEAGDGDCYAHGESCGKEEIEGAEPAVAQDEGVSDADGKVVQRDQPESAESPENEGVRDAGEGALLDDFRLQEDFGKEIPDSLAEGLKGEAWVGFGGLDYADDFSEAPPEALGGGGKKDQEDQDFYKGWRGHLL